MLKSFETFVMVRDGVRLYGRRARSGPPLLLLHGHPQTHAIWHRVAPALAERFTVVLTDLRGYGDSARPGAGREQRAYSKREMALDAVAVMRELRLRALRRAGARPRRASGASAGRWTIPQPSSA